MGLAERRAAQNFKDQRYPALKQRIDEAAGFEVPMDVKWETLAINDYAHLYDECFPKVYFDTLTEAFKNIAVDAMGKEALKGGLKRVVVQNVKDCSSAPSCFDFE